MWRTALVVLSIAACEAAEASPDRTEAPPAVEPAVESATVSGSTQAAAAPIAAPAACWPVPQPFDLARDAVARLPVSTRAVGRRTATEVLVEVRAIAGRPETAEVVIGGHTIPDLREPVSYRRMIRWFDSMHIELGSGWDPRERGFAIAAEAGVDAAIVAEVMMFAAGSSLAGPVDVVLRHPGTSATTTIPVVLGESGVALEHGPWGAWARAIDAADPSTTVVLDIPEIPAATWKARDRLGRIGVDLRLQSAVRAHEFALGRYRRGLEYCGIAAAVLDPDLRGTWTVEVARGSRGADHRVEVTPDASPRLTSCIERMVPRWRLPPGDGPLVFSVIVAARP